MTSFSDAWFGFLNKVCEEIEKKERGLDFNIGSLAYMNYIMPPSRIKLNPRIIPVLAPITFNRFACIGTKDAVTSELLEDIIRKWTTLSPRVGMYLYNFNLADMAMPYSRRLHWVNDFPKIYAMGIRDITIESHPNWHTMMPGNYIAAQLLWNVNTDVKALLDEYYPAYYGPAADAMRRYDMKIEAMYQNSKVFAGGLWGMHRIFTSESIGELESAISEAQKKASGKGVFEQRVEIMRFSLNFAEIWLAARSALNNYNFEEAAKQGNAFINNYKTAYAKYPLYFGKNVDWSPNIERYFNLFHNTALQDAGRISREGKILVKIPDELMAFPEVVDGTNMPSTKIPDLEKEKWVLLKTFSKTLGEQGMPLFRGIIWYKHEFVLSTDAAKEKKYMLWFGGIDSKIRVWINGVEFAEQHVGNFKPYELDVTSAIKPTQKNILLVAVDNTFPNEIGIGGIVRPAVIYVPKY